MGLRERDGWNYGDGPDDIRPALVAWIGNGYPLHHFRLCGCRCGNAVFLLDLDDASGVAVRTCTSCGVRHFIADSEEYVEEAELERGECPCGSKSLQLGVGVSLYEGSDDVKWLYLGGRCATCGMVAAWGDWRCDAGNYLGLLDRV